MARIRSIKPEFFRHAGLYDAERETGLPLRVAFAGLWTCADRDGRFRWRPRELKLDCLPFDDVDFSRVLDALTTRGFLVRYACQDEEFGCIPSFKRHQVINNKERQSDLPAPEDGQDTNDLTRAPRVNDACPTPLNLSQGEGKGREEEGKEASEPKEGSGGRPPPSPVDQKAELFRRAQEVLGKGSGGLVVKLIRANGGEDERDAIPKSRAAIEMAAARTGGDETRAREYIGRVLKPKAAQSELDPALWRDPTTPGII